ncbi:hypothetical protein VTK26DRAFT_9315 [Humicola hyalothermophila]
MVYGFVCTKKIPSVLLSRQHLKVAISSCWARPSPLSPCCLLPTGRYFVHDPSYSSPQLPLVSSCLGPPKQFRASDRTRTFLQSRFVVKHKCSSLEGLPRCIRVDHVLLQ